MSDVTEGWDDDVDFDDEDEDEAINVYNGHQDNQDERSQGLSLGNGMFMGRLANLVSKVADEGQINEDISSGGEGSKPKSSLASRITSMLAPSLSADGDGWDDDDISEEVGWEDEDNLDDIDVKEDNHLEPTRSISDVESPVKSSPQDGLVKSESQRDDKLKASTSTGWETDDDLLDIEGSGTTQESRHDEKDKASNTSSVSVNSEEKLELRKAIVSTPVAANNFSSNTAENSDEGESGWDKDDGLEDLDISISTQEAANASEEVNQMSEKAGNDWKQDENDLVEINGANEPNLVEGEHATNENNMVSIIEQDDEELNSLDVASNQQPAMQEEQASSPLVDQVPNRGAPPVPLRDSTIVMGSERSTTLDEETLDEQDFGPVVDHLPPPDRSGPERAHSIATQARFEDLDQDSKEVGEDTEPGQTSEETMNRATGTPSVVDHVPTIQETTRTFIKDSNFAVASQQSSTVMEDIWREDFDPNDEDYGPVVDHLPPTQTPTPSIRSLRTASSLVVQGAIVEEDDDTKEDASEKRRFGIFSGASVADSIAVVAPIAEHEDEENTVGQTVDGTIDGIVDGVDDETVSNAFPVLDTTAQSEPLVDHVPLRREIRPADAPNSVMADQLELSTVGDLTYEEVQYGPVVDHTPPPDPSWQASAAASIIVAATKSECPDDFEDDIDGETCAMGTTDDGATVETSLCDHNLADENLVDHVPETPGLRRVNSSSAIAEAQSVISTRDDEFGLVVDHTPIPPIGSTPGPRDSVGALATLSEGGTLQSDEVKSLPGSITGRQVEVDKIPAPFKRSKADSTYTIKSHGEKEDSNTLDETLELDEYGPVVDHLPPGSTVLSRGGSTTGGLATLSEANFDGGTTDADGDGWDEDDEVNDMETSVGDEFQQDTPETRNKSVTFQNLEGAPILPSIPDTTHVGRDLPQHHGMVLNAVNFSDGSVTDNKMKQLNSHFPSGYEKDEPCPDESCFDLATPKDKNEVVLENGIGDGTPLSFDYQERFQEEVGKRQKLEKEIEKYKVALSDASSMDATTVPDKDQKEMKRLLRSNMDLSNRLTSQRDEFTSQLECSKAEKIGMIGEVKKIKERLSELKSHNDALTTSESKLQAEFSDLKIAHEQQRESSYQEVQNLQGKLRKESDLLEKAQSIVENLENENAALKQKLVNVNESVLNLTEIVSEFKEKEQGYKGKIEKFQEMLSDSNSMAELQIHLNKKIASLNKELESKCNEIEDLQGNSAANSLELERCRVFQVKHDELQRKISELEEKALVTEQGHKEEIENYIAKHQVAERELDETRAEIRAISQIKLEVESRCKALEEVSREKDDLDMKLSSLKKENSDLLDEQQREKETQSNLISDFEEARKKHKETIFNYEKDVKALQNEIDTLNTVQGKYNDLVVKVSAKESKIASQDVTIQNYKSEISEKLNRANSVEENLLKEPGEGASHREMVDDQKVSQARNQELADLRMRLDLVSAEAQKLKLERDNLKHTISELRQDQHASNESMGKKLRLENEKYESTQQELRNMTQIESGLRSDLDTLTKERDSLLRELSEMESDSEEMLVQLGLHKEELDIRDKDIIDLRKKLASIEKTNELKINDLQQAEERMRRLEDSTFEDKENQREEIERYKVQLGAKDREMNVLSDALRASEASNVKTKDDLRNAEERIRQFEQEKLQNYDQKQESEICSNTDIRHLSQSVEQLTLENSQLKHQVDELVSAKSVHEEKLRAKSLENEAMQKQLENLHIETKTQTVGTGERNASFDSVHKDLEQKIIHLDNLRVSQEKEIERLTTEYSSKEKELKDSEDKLSKAEEALLRMELEANFDGEEGLSKDEYENLLAEANEKICSYEKSLELSKAKSVELELEFSAAMKDLQVEREKNTMSKDDDDENFINQDQKLSTLLMELSTTKNLLSSKEEEVERLSLELEECRTEQLEATQKMVTNVLESDMSREEAENSENMRKLIISLSQALEKSETQRADGIERLLREQKTNADSLRKLGESVKRFYVSLNATSPQR